jgi:hypothetical protein
MNTSTTTRSIQVPSRCQHSDRNLGCARTAGHEGAHWLTSQPAAAHADLRRNGFWSRSIDQTTGPVR